MKIPRRLWRKMVLNFSVYLTVLAMIFNTSYPVFYAVALAVEDAQEQEGEVIEEELPDEEVVEEEAAPDESSASQEEELVEEPIIEESGDEEEPSPDEPAGEVIISDEAAVTENPEEEIADQETPKNEEPESDVQDEIGRWHENENGSMTVLVEEGGEYEYKDSGLKIKFTRIDDGVGEITVEEIELTDEQMEKLGALSNKAWDITSDMENGTFEYELTLPTEGDVNEDEIEVVYVEDKDDLNDEEKIKSVDGDDVKVDNEKQEIKAEDLDHFTVFILVSPDESLNTNNNGVTNEDNAWVSDNQRVTFNNDNDYAVYGFPDLAIPSGSNINGIEVLVEGYASSSRDFEISLWNISNSNPDAYTSIKEANMSSSETMVTVGGPTDKWGNNWEISDFSDVDFKVRVDADNDSGDAYLDYLGVKVYYQPPLHYDSSDDYALTAVSGIWTDVNGGSNVNGLNTEEVRWGNSTGYGQSGLRFDGSGLQSFNEGNDFYLGALTHFNWPIYNAADGATLKITLQFEKPEISPDPQFTFDFDIEETSNTAGSCPSWRESDTPCDDKITFPSIYGEESFEIGDKLYTLEILGFVDSYPDGNPVSEFITEEQKNNTAFLVGRLSSILVAHPAVSIKKKTNDIDVTEAPGQNLNVGGVVDWQYIVQNTGNVELTNVSVSDNPSVVISCPKTTLVPGEDMTCTASGTVVVGQFSNMATVVGYHTNGEVNDSDSSWYFGIIPEKKVKLCHATATDSNPFDLIEVSINSVSQCEDVNGHGDHADDIIPPFSFGECSYPGKNWDLIGEAIWDNDCVVPFGSITITKNVIPDDNSVWDFTLSGNGVNLSANDLADGQSYLFSHLVPGSYNLTEITQAGYTPSIVCNDVAGDPGSNDYLANVAAGQNISCVITNTRDAGSVTVNKSIDNDGDGTFESGNVLANELDIEWTLDGGAGNDMGVTLSNVNTTVGEEKYTVSEDLNSQPYHFVGWYLGDGNCNNLNGTTLPAEITVAKDTNTSVTFCNARDMGTIVVDKVTNPAGSAQEFTINLSQGSASEPTLIHPYVLTDQENAESFSVPTGEYWLEEVAIGGWDLTNAACFSSSDPTNAFDPRADGFDLTSGDTITCTFTNTQRGSISGIKWNDLNGDGIKDDNEPGLQGWSIGLRTDLTSHGAGSMATDVNGEYTFTNVAPGDYYVCEYSWPSTIESWIQRYPNSGSQLNGFYCHQFTLNPGENKINVDFGNQQVANLKVCKEDNEGNRLPGWEMILGEMVDGPRAINVSDGSGTDSVDLPEGEYLIKVSGTYRYGNSQMNADAGYSYRPMNIPSGCDCWKSGFDLASNGLMAWLDSSPVDWGYYNDSHEYLYIYNHTNDGQSLNVSIWDDYYGDNLNNNFQFEIYEIERKGTTGSDGCTEFKDVPFGDYYLDEILKEYWLKADGTGMVTVDDQNEEFVVTNEDHTPYCGDGIKNQESEQCDGEAGVADDGSEFCTSQCKLVPIYDGEHKCPEGTVERLIGGITLDSQSDLSQKLDLLAGNSYLLKASGTYYYSGSDTQRQADPAYGTTNGFSTWREDIGIWGTNRGVTSIIGDLGRGMGVIEWDDDKNINSEHIYSKLVEPANNLTAEFVISDWYGDWYGPYCGEQGCMGDNSGSLNVDLYQCVDPGSIQGRKYRDVNGNGDFDQNEKTEPNRLDGWEITLYDDQWQAVKSMKTGDDDTEAGDVLKGQYHFVNLVPGTYYVCETGQEGWIQTEPDTSFVKNDLSCHQVVVSAGQSVNEIQFGNYELGVIQGRKYQDNNLDGKHQGPDNEARLDDWGIRLYQEGSEGWVSVGSEAKTGENSSNFGDVEIGQYRFGNLNSGDYYVCEVMKDGWVQTGPILNSEPVDNNGNPTSSGLAVENLSGAEDEGSICWKTTLGQSGQINDSLKFGNVQKAEISGVKWEDLDGDGQGDEAKIGWEIIMGNLKEIDSYAVDSKAVSAVNTDILENGKNYLLKVEGTFDAGDSIVADAECSSRNGSSWNTIVKNYESYGEALLDLDLDGSATDWGLCNPNNVYTKNIFGEGSSLSLKINDIYPSNNSGSLNVTLYEFENYQSDTTDNNGEYLFDVYHFGQIGVCETSQKDWIQTYPNSNSGSCYIFDINAGDEIGKLDFANVKLHDIHGFKWNDINGDRMENCGVDDGDQCEEKLAGWEIFLDEDGDQEWDEGEKKTTTSNDPDPKHFGWYWFEDLLPGEYSVCEVLRSEEGWKQTSPGNFEEPQCYTVSLPDSNTAQHEVEENMVDGPVYKFGNQYQPCNLFLSKDTRDWINGPKKVGDKVLYEIVVRAMNNFCKNVKVTDLPPETFSYVDGSWGASSNMRPGFSLGEPTYASPGDWNIGDMQEGEEITLTYQAEIGENTEAGIYPDLAWAQGIDPSGSSLLALAEESEFETDYKGKIDDTFVGTQIEVENPDVAPTVKVRADRDEVIEEEEVEVKVKGASYFPATGANGFWVALALLGILIGGGIASIGYLLKKNKKMDKVIGLFLGLIISGMLVSGALAQTASLISVRLSEPDSHVTGPFNLEFVVMNTTEEEMTVECRKKNSTDSEFVTFDSVDLQAGGDSDVCLVDDSVLTTAGNYDFMVVAKTDSAERSSDTVSVLYDGVGPKTPEYIKKDEETSCRNEVEFKTANDGQTVRVEIYRSQHTRDIVANEDSKIISFDIGPNQKKVFDDDLGPTGCGDNYYYAVRAFDEAGNSSGVRAEEFEVIIEEEKIIEVVEEQSAPTGGIVLAGTVNEEGGEVAGEEAVVEGEAGEENQLEIGEGAQAEDETEVLGEETERGLIGYLKNWRTWLLIGILAAIGWQIYARKVKPKEGN